MEAGTSEMESQAGRAPAREAVQAPQKRNVFRVLTRNPLVIAVIVVVLAVGVVGGVLYFRDLETKVAIETSEISAPVISIGPETAGVLKTLYVKEGDRVTSGQPIFSVGDRVTTARTAGVVTSVQNTPGQWASQQSVIVQMFDPTALRVVGHVQEDLGLSDIKVGQKVNFTVDAYSSQQYVGTVESIAKSADQGSIAFSISDKRQERQFAVKVAFDVNAYPELRNGMSARMWILK